MNKKFIVVGVVVSIVVAFSSLLLIKVMFTTEKNWAIGLYTGATPFDISGGGIENPIITADDITDVSARFVADPFLIKHDDVYYLFFEILLEKPEKGVIGVAVSNNGIDWSYKNVVLDESFHLSYPYVFEHDGGVYMIPETGEAKAVYLYKASLDEFPYKWVRVKELITGYVEDSSIVMHDGLFWLFGQTNKGKYDRLELWFSEQLDGEWEKHPKSPVINGDPNIARPGGRIIKYNNKMYRFSQDDYPSYGNQVWVSEIVKLTTSEFEEELLDSPVISAANERDIDLLGGWNESGMHHMDPLEIKGIGWIVAVDGLGEELVMRKFSF